MRQKKKLQVPTRWLGLRQAQLALRSNHQQQRPRL